MNAIIIQEQASFLGGDAFIKNHQFWFYFDKTMRMKKMDNTSQNS